MNYKYLLIVGFAAAIGGSYYLGYTPPLVSLLIFLISLLAYFYYAKDKKAAINQTWRVSENTLHLLAVCGGWPGALMAQEKLRHKTKKLGFRVVFWGTVLVNIAGVSWCHTPHGRQLLGDGISEFENLVVTYVKSEVVMSTVLTLTKFRSHGR